MLHPLISLALAQARQDDLLREGRRGDPQWRYHLPDGHAPRRRVARLRRFGQLSRRQRRTSNLGSAGLAGS